MPQNASSVKAGNIKELIKKYSDFKVCSPRFRLFSGTSSLQDNLDFNPISGSRIYQPAYGGSSATSIAMKSYCEGLHDKRIISEGPEDAPPLYS
jgi:hypothetical protein